MGSASEIHGDHKFLESVQKPDICGTSDGRRSANYKPNIWKYDRIQSLDTQYNEEKHAKEAQELRDEVMQVFGKTVDPLAKIELIDTVEKIGLSDMFGDVINEALRTIFSNDYYKNHLSITNDLYATSLCFRLLRQHGYVVFQDVFIKFLKGWNSDVKGMLQLYEASHLATVDEHILSEAKSLSEEILKTSINSGLINDEHLTKQITIALKLPSQWSVKWYNVKIHIQILGESDNTSINETLLKLAKLNFNMVQATHQKELRHLSRWWRDLGVVESLSFTRNRLVESYLWSMGVAFEPLNASLRKWLTKVIKLIIIIDDVYDIYGSPEELVIFTGAVDRWDIEEIKTLPECMKICFQTLYDTTNEIASEVQKEKGWGSFVETYLRKAWADFCKALHVEAEWDNKNYTPSLEEYLNNGRITSPGPSLEEYLNNGRITSSGLVLSIHIFFSITDPVQQEQVENLLQWSQDLMHSTSLIIRLCNDEGTSAAELERGDAPSSILCLMREENVSEEVARKKIRNRIKNIWMKVNKEWTGESSSMLKPFFDCAVNTARVAHFIYQSGDGFGVQDRETRDQVLSLLVEPLVLD